MASNMRREEIRTISIKTGTVVCCLSHRQHQHAFTDTARLPSDRQEEANRLYDQRGGDALMEDDRRV